MADFSGEFERAIATSDAAVVCNMLFDDNGQAIRRGAGTEKELWDYKAIIPGIGKANVDPWAEIAIDVLAMHNHRGGALVFGVTDDFKCVGTSTHVDSKSFNDKIRRYVGDSVWVDYHREFIREDQSYIGIAIIRQRGPLLTKFQSDAPKRADGKHRFREGWSAIRRGDSSQLLDHAAAGRETRSLAVPVRGEPFAVNEAFFKIPAPDYSRFVVRPELCDSVLNALADPRTAVTSLLGIGGMGKTALATWAAIQAYEASSFDFIASITAKDRELSTTGILAVTPELTTFESLLDSVLDVLGFEELKSANLDERESSVRELLESSRGLLFVDNLETVDDKRVIAFLDSLPLGTRALTTSRRSVVRVSVNPVDVGPMTEEETINFVESLTEQPGLAYLRDGSEAEWLRIAQSCDGIPLAVHWSVARSSSVAEALATADQLTASGRRGEELLEFSFRRVFDAMTAQEREVLQVLSIFQRAIPTEALIVGTNGSEHLVIDAVESLAAESLVQRVFDPKQNDWFYTLLPIARAFVHGDLARHKSTERRIRTDLTDWFEARDVTDDEERLLVREMRQGNAASDEAMIDLGNAANERNDVDSAQRLYEQAIRRNPQSWKAQRQLAELHRHKRDDIATALELYSQAAQNAPKSGGNRALIFREWGMLLRDAGIPDGTERAIGCLEIAHEETPNDALASHALAHMYSRKGNWRRVIELLEPLANHDRLRTREKTYPLLLKAYDNCGEMLKAAQLKQRMADDD